MLAVHPQMQDAYVITSDGNIYTLHIENSANAREFASSFTVNINHEFGVSTQAAFFYKEAQARFENSSYSTAERHAFSLAYVLEQSNSGIRLLKGTLNRTSPTSITTQFEQLGAQIDGATLTIQNCK